MRSVIGLTVRQPGFTWRVVACNRRPRRIHITRRKAHAVGDRIHCPPGEVYDLEKTILAYVVSGNDNIAAARVIVRRARAHSPRHRLHPMPSATGPTRRIAASPPRSNRQGEGLRDSKDARARWSSTTSHHRSPPASRPSDDRPADDACCDDRRVSLRHDRIRNADEETDDQSASPRRYRQLNSRREHSNRKPPGEGRRKRRRAIAEFEGGYQLWQCPRTQDHSSHLP